MLKSIFGIALCVIAFTLTLTDNTKSDRYSNASAKANALKVRLSKLISGQISELTQAQLVIFLGGSIFAGAILVVVTGSIILAGFSSIISFYLALYGARKKRRSKLENLTLTYWPSILSELGLRIGAMGSPLPNAFFSAGRTTPEQLSLAFEQAERSFGITGSFDAALETLKRNLPDQGTKIVTELLGVVKDAPGTDITRMVEDLRIDRLAEKERREEYQARLAGVRFARYFVIIVPVGMFLAGIAISGIAPFCTPLGEYGLSIAFALLLICWTWATKLANVSNLYQEE